MTNRSEGWVSIGTKLRDRQTIIHVIRIWRKEGARDQSINHRGNILCFTFDVEWENYKTIQS